MALQKDFVTTSGVTCNYHRIISVRLDQDEKMAYGVIGVYYDATARANGSDPVEVIERMFGHEDAVDGATVNNWDSYFDAASLDVVNKNPIETFYERLKTLDEYTGAVDV